jgi:hypothetical protein
LVQVERVSDTSLDIIIDGDGTEFYYNVFTSDMEKV